MKPDNRNPQPILREDKLAFFYAILTLWESGEDNKVVKNFGSREIKRFLEKRDSNGSQILFFKTDINKKCFNCKYEIYVKDSKRNYGMSLLYHLRNAFAHNDIQLDNEKRIIRIHHTWKNSVRLKTTIPFKVLKELVETIRGQHNLTEEEKKKRIRKNKKSK
jgi:hypothetical protein